MSKRKSVYMNDKKNENEYVIITVKIDVILSPYRFNKLQRSENPLKIFILFVNFLCVSEKD